MSSVNMLAVLKVLKHSFISLSYALEEPDLLHKKFFRTFSGVLHVFLHTLAAFQLSFHPGITVWVP